VQVIAGEAGDGQRWLGPIVAARPPLIG